MFRYLSASLLFLMPFLSVAQGDSFVESASIIANSIEIDAEGNLTAKGNVEVHYKENILKAKEIYYARSSDELSAKGPSTRSKSQRQSRVKLGLRPSNSLALLEFT